ncbi:hypothetical protein Dimus_029016 [Dionaea muscipula]
MRTSPIFTVRCSAVPTTPSLLIKSSFITPKLHLSRTSPSAAEDHTQRRRTTDEEQALPPHLSTTFVRRRPTASSVPPSRRPHHRASPSFGINPRSMNLLKFHLLFTSPRSHDTHSFDSDGNKEVTAV